MIPLTATIKENVHDLYLNGRDATNPEVSFWADLLDSLRGTTYNVMSRKSVPVQGMLVTLDTKHLTIVFKGTLVEYMTIEESLVDFPENIGVITQRR